MLALTFGFAACSGASSPPSQSGIVGAFTAYSIPPVNSTGLTSAEFITSGPDGALWITEFEGNAVGRITTAGTVTQFPLPTAAASPEAITTGSDGALWFVERDGNKIGRITTAGAITEYPLPAGLGSPIVLTSGPDGARWFIGGGASVIGRVTTHGAFTAFPIPNHSIDAVDIATGPDGALWFTEDPAGVVPNYPNASSAIGRMTTDGKFSSYPLPVAASSPLGIAPGADGALWFADVTGVGRITTAGVVSQYAINSETDFVCPGPDSAMWVTSSGHGTSTITRVSLAGSVRVFLTPPTLDGPIGITTGSDGALWFASGSGIGRLH